jgi:2-methylcitrate dehydratase PrpD
MSTDQTPLTRKLAEFSRSFELNRAPASVARNAKLAILDCLGVSILALSQEAGHAMLSFARANAATGSCTVWGTDIMTNPRDAAFCNGILSHALDFDDRNHSSTFTLAAGMAAAEHRALSGRQLLEAFIVGREVRNCLDKLFSSRNSGIGPGARGWHSNGILGAIAATCSVGRALGLDQEHMLAAIGLAAGSCGALTRDGGTMAKPFRTGHAAATGLTCALLAEHGFSSDATALEGRYGLLEALSPIPDDVIQALGSELGDKFNLESDIRSKPFASCTATHSATEAILRLRIKHVIDPQEVNEIRCDLKPYPLVRQIPSRGFEGRFSMSFCLAIALLDGRLEADDFTDANVSRPDVQALMNSTVATPGERCVQVTMRDGTQLSEALLPPSDFTTDATIEEKFRRCVAGALSRQQTHDVIALIQELETLRSIRQLSEALRNSDDPSQLAQSA